MTKLEWALYLVERGFFVFPLKADVPGDEKTGKEPLMRGWQGIATRDTATVTRWFTDGMGPFYNIGIAWWMSGHCAVDLDIKRGKDGIAEWQSLCEQHGLPPSTLMLQTWSGGLQLIFRDPEAVIRNSVSRLAAGIDTRGEDGYSVGPGSTICGKPYSVINDEDPAIIPTWVVDHLNRGCAQADRETAEYDEEWAVEYAWQEMRRERGQWGVYPEPGAQDHLIYGRTRRLRNIGAPPEIALEILEEWAAKGDWHGATADGRTLEDFIDHVWSDKHHEAEFGSELPPKWDDGAADFAEHIAAMGPEQWQNPFEGFALCDTATLPPITFHDPHRLLPNYASGGTGTLWGFSSTYKTAIVLTWAYELARAGVRVAYVLGERKEDVGARVRGLLARGFEPYPELVRGYPMPSVWHDGAMAQLALAMKEHAPQVVFIDTLAAFAAGYREDREVAELFTANGAMGKMSRDLGALVLAVDHTAWDKKHEFGSAGKRHNADVSIAAVANAKVDEGEIPTHIQVIAKKIKGAALPEPVHYRLEAIADTKLPVWCSEAEWMCNAIKSKESLGKRYLAFEEIAALLSATEQINTATLAAKMLSNWVDIKESQQARDYLKDKLEKRAKEFAALNNYLEGGELRWSKR